MKLIRRVPRERDTRIARWFAFLPVTVRTEGQRETRWLEFVAMEQEYFGGTWFNEEFVDDE